MIYEQEDGACVISSHRTWLPGHYADKRTAKYAFRFPSQVLQILQDRVNAANADVAKRVITFEMLQEARRSPPEL